MSNKYDAMTVDQLKALHEQKLQEARDVYAAASAKIIAESGIEIGRVYKVTDPLSQHVNQPVLCRSVEVGYPGRQRTGFHCFILASRELKNQENGRWGKSEYRFHADRLELVEDDNS